VSGEYSAGRTRGTVRWVIGAVVGRVQPLPGGAAQQLQDPRQGLAVGLGQSGEYLVEARLPVRASPGQLGGASRGDPQQGGPPVVGIRLPLEQPVGLQGVHHRGDGAGDHPEPVSELAHALWRVGVECGQQSAASEGQAAGAALPAALDATTSPEQLAHSEERLGQGLRTGADWSVGPQRREPGATPTVTVPVRPTASAMSAVLVVLVVLVVLIVLIVLIVRPGRLPRGRRCVLRHYILQVVESGSLYAVLNEIGTADIPGLVSR